MCLKHRRRRSTALRFSISKPGRTRIRHTPGLLPRETRRPFPFQTAIMNPLRVHWLSENASLKEPYQSIHDRMGNRARCPNNVYDMVEKVRRHSLCRHQTGNHFPYYSVRPDRCRTLREFISFHGTCQEAVVTHFAYASTAKR